MKVQEMALISFCSVFITVEDFSAEPSANQVKPESNQLFTNLQPRIPHTCFQCTFFCEILGLKIKMFSSWQQTSLKCATARPSVIDSKGPSSIIKSPNIRCFVAKPFVSRFTRCFRGRNPIFSIDRQNFLSIENILYR